MKNKQKVSKKEEIPEGYKNTEIGLIPNEWELKELKDIGTFKNGINKSKKDFGVGFPFVNLDDVFSNNRISTNKDLKLVKSSIKDKEKYNLCSGDILFVRSSVKPEGVGLTSLISNDLDNTVYSGFLIRYRENYGIVNNLKRYLFHELGFRNRLIANSTVSANTNINQSGLECLKVAFPKSLKEQSAIAEALSDVDDLISALDELISKKKKVKKATMQRLLTGEQRLPGFDGEWEEKRLGDIAVIEMGSSPSSSSYNNQDKGLPFVGGKSDLKSRKSNPKLFVSQVTKSCNKGDILMTVRAPVGYIAFANSKLCLGRGVCSITSDSINNKFLFFKLVYSENTWKKLEQGSTFSSANSNQIKSFKLFTSLDKKEQEAIATILSDMDEEIQALEKKREKYRKIKRGMMQELLTGRTRLAVSC